MPSRTSHIDRHKTAIKRNDLSLPIKCLINDHLILPDGSTSVFDYGCGHGESVCLLNAQGIECRGWDPAYRSESPLVASDIVNLGYVINVIEDPRERRNTLRQAWDLAQKLLVVAAQIKVNGRGESQVEFGDGCLTRIGTFQKYYTQSELREYLQAELEMIAVPAAPGVFYVFRDEALMQRFLAHRYRRRQAMPKKRLADLRYEQHRELLESLTIKITELGRLPESDEFDRTSEIENEFGSLKRAFLLVRKITGEDAWKELGRAQTEDLLVFLALARFRRRPALSSLPLQVQRDIREFFGSYKAACEHADLLLFKTGQAGAIDEACRQSKVGKLLPNALYVHRTALDSLDPLLRIFEGCARAYVGEIEDTNIVKLHRLSGKISYLTYPDFEKMPHPELRRSVKVNLRNLELECWDYSQSDNPPVLHRKEAFLTGEHPLYNRFARLTTQEEQHGLLDETASIGTRLGWATRLREKGFGLRGHRLVKAKPQV
jgi:DNA phosphorothioation-associated putative methyltransferase